MKKIDLELVHDCGVSSLSIIDENNYGIGFYNGFIYLKYGGKSFQSQIHNGPVTGVEFNQKYGKFICSGIDGLINTINLDSISL